MNFRMALCCLFILALATVDVQAKNFDTSIFPRFLPGKEFSPFESKRIKISSADFDKPITKYGLYFHIVPRIGPANYPILDLIVTIKRPCSDVKELVVPSELKEIRLDEFNSRHVTAGQTIPNSTLWQIRDKNGRVVRQWEPCFIDWLRCDGDHHFGTKVWLPNDDLKNSYLLLYFEHIDEDQLRDDVVIEIDLRDLQWPKMKQNSR